MRRGLREIQSREHLNSSESTITQDRPPKLDLQLMEACNLNGVRGKMVSRFTSNLI